MPAGWIFDAASRLRLGQGLQLCYVADRRACSMPLEISDGVDAVSRALVGAAQGKHLSGDLRPGDAALAVRRDAPAADHRIGRVMVRKRVFVAHEHHHAASLARPEAGRLSVKNAHLVARKRAQAGEARKFKGIKAEINAAGDGNIHIAALQGRARGGDSQQA